MSWTFFGLGQQQLVETYTFNKLYQCFLFKSLSESIFGWPFPFFFLPRSAPSGSEAVPAREPLTINLSSAAAQPPAAQQVPQVPSQVSWPSLCCLGWIFMEMGGIRKLSSHFERENSSVSLKFWRFWACWWNFLMKYWDPTLQLCITHWKLLCGLPPLWFLLWNQSIPVTNGVGYVYYIRYTYSIYKHISKHIYIYTKHIHIFT